MISVTIQSKDEMGSGAIHKKCALYYTGLVLGVPQKILDMDYFGSYTAVNKSGRKVYPMFASTVIFHASDQFVWGMISYSEFRKRLLECGVDFHILEEDAKLVEEV